MSETKQTVDLDCPPGATRPWELIEGVMEGTGVEIKPEHTEPAAFFGHQQFVFEVDREEWVSRVQPIIQPRIVALYQSGAIRYGSW